ncbi:hypothetical protein KQH56_03215 [bacterium]|nr:hypothetical protein [bacterium]
MTRIIKTTTPGKERAKLSKAIVITIREFMRLKEPTIAAKDMVAFIILALQEIAAGIEKSVVAWEKRGYWVKADKYRMEWRWSGQLAEKLAAAFKDENWPNIAGLLVEIMGQFENIKVSDRHRMGKPWVGALKEYQASLQD